MTRRIPPGRISRIHVNRQRIDANTKHGTSQPTITVKRGGRNYYAHAIAFEGPVTVVTAGLPGPDGVERKQLSCGARIYLETKAGMVLTKHDKYTSEVFRTCQV